MATATPAPQTSGLDSVKESNPGTGERPALLNQNLIEAEEDSAEVDSAFGSDM